MIRTAIDWLSARLGWGYVVLTLANLVLFVWVEIDFARNFPTYTLTEGWPTISRALAHADRNVISALALLAAPGLLVGAVGSLVLFGQLWRRGVIGGWRGAAGLANAGCAGLLSLPYFWMVTVTLSDDNSGHMLHSYTFFFGMSFVILVDAFVALPQRAHAATGVGGMVRQVALWQRRGGWIVLGSAAAFLALYLLKNWEWLGTPLRDGFQKAFAVSELVWIALAHAYALSHWWMLLAHRAAVAPTRSPIIDPMMITKGVR